MINWSRCKHIKQRPPVFKASKNGRMMNSWHPPRITTPRTLKPLNFCWIKQLLELWNSIYPLTKARNDGREKKWTQRLTIPVKRFRPALSSPWRVSLFVPPAVAWVSGVSGEKGKDGSEKGRELKERNFLSLLPLPPPPSKISSHLAP